MVYKHTTPTLKSLIRRRRAGVDMMAERKEWSSEGSEALGEIEFGAEEANSYQVQCLCLLGW